MGRILFFQCNGISCQPNHWSMLIMLEKLSAQVIFLSDLGWQSGTISHTEPASYKPQGVDSIMFMQPISITLLSDCTQAGCKGCCNLLQTVDKSLYIHNEWFNILTPGLTRYQWLSARLQWHHCSNALELLQSCTKLWSLRIPRSEPIVVVLH